MRPGINSTQKLLTLDFPTSPSLRNFAGFTPGASQAREDSRRYREKRDRSLLSEAAKEKGFDELLELSGLWTGEPANLKKCQDKSSDSRLRRISMTVGLSSLRTLERETGFEPATSTLARLHSTTELLPHRKLLFNLCPRDLSTGQRSEISNVSKSQNQEEKTFSICHCSFVIWHRQMQSRFNAKYSLGGFLVIPNEQ